jgi:hypothetical protein
MQGSRLASPATPVEAEGIDAALGRFGIEMRDLLWMQESSQDRISLALTVRTMKEENEKRQRHPEKSEPNPQPPGVHTCRM